MANSSCEDDGTQVGGDYRSEAKAMLLGVRTSSHLQAPEAEIAAVSRLGALVREYCLSERKSAWKSDPENGEGRHGMIGLREPDYRIVMGGHCASRGCLEVADGEMLM